MNWEMLEGKFMQVEGAIREKWGKLSSDDMDRIAGQHEQLIGRIQERYGITREAAEREVEEWWKSAYSVPPENPAA